MRKEDIYVEIRFILPPNPDDLGDSRVISARLPNRLIANLDAAADKSRRSRNDVLHRCVAFALSVLEIPEE